MHEELLREVARAQTPWAAVEMIAHFWRDHPELDDPTKTLELMSDAGEVIDATYEESRLLRKQRTTSGETFLEAERRALVRNLGEHPPEFVKAVAWGFDKACWRDFNNEWVKLRADTTWRPQPDEYFPVTDWVSNAAGFATSIRPSSIENPRSDFPHVRQFKPHQYDGQPIEIEFDFRYSGFLESLLEPPLKIGAVLPNFDLEREFSRPIRDRTFFPVKPKLPDQSTRITEQFSSAVIEGAVFVVLPELSIDAEIQSELLGVVQAFGKAKVPVLLVAGSVHDVTTRRNTATVLFSDDTLDPIQVSKVTPWTQLVSEKRSSLFEGIEPGPLVIPVLCSQTHRVAVSICKDYLSSSIRGSLIHAGVNCVGVPTMSASMFEFVTSAATHVQATQGVVVVANAARRFLGEDVQPQVIVGQPLDEQVVCQMTVAPPSHVVHQVGSQCP